MSTIDLTTLDIDEDEVFDVLINNGEEKALAHEDLSKPGNGENWIEKSGQLPAYIQHIAKDLHEERGMPLSRAIATAISLCKKWASGGKNVKPDTRAKAAKAIAEWEALKAKNAARKAGKAATKGLDMGDAATIDSVGDQMAGIEYKNVGVRGLRVADPQTGIVEAIVSVTGIKDEVNDVIKPGAYAKTLAKRTPKGVYSHAWDQPISKTLDIKELLPGDPALPKAMANGTPWPEGAGALWVKMQFNLDTERGKTAFSDVKFFGDEQEWSIGYNVPVGGAKVNPKAGVREIDYLDLFEYSPVLFGAMPLAATQSVKTAQTAFKAMQGQWTPQTWTDEDADAIEAVDALADEQEEKAKTFPAGDWMPAEDGMTCSRWGCKNPATKMRNVKGNRLGACKDHYAEMSESKGMDDEAETKDADGVTLVNVYEDGTIEDADLDEDLDEYEEPEVDEVGIKALFGPDDMHLVVKALTALNDLLGEATGHKAISQVPGDDMAGQTTTDADLVGNKPRTVEMAVRAWLQADTPMRKAAEDLDAALGSSDDDAIESAANDLLDMIEAEMAKAPDRKRASALTKTARFIGEAISASGSKNPPSEDTTATKSVPSPDAEEVEVEVLEGDHEGDTPVVENTPETVVEEKELEVVDLSDLNRLMGLID